MVEEEEEEEGQAEVPVSQRSEKGRLQGAGASGQAESKQETSHLGNKKADGRKGRAKKKSAKKSKGGSQKDAGGEEEDLDSILRSLDIKIVRGSCFEKFPGITLFTEIMQLLKRLY